MKEWSNLAKVVYKRTYARHDKGPLENWEDTVKRIIEGNTKQIKVSQKEKDRLFYYIFNRKAMPAGRGLWFSGSPAHDILHGAGLVNCWAFIGDDWKNLVIAQDLLMLGGGVGLSIEHKYVSKLPKIKKDVKIEHLNTKDADFIVPDSRQGWCRLTNKILTSFFETGEGFTFSTICVRGAGEPIKGFGGKSSGPRPLVDFVVKFCSILKDREGTHLRTIDMMDLLCSIGELVVSGNVRRSAILILGDPWDKEFLKSKRWDLGTIPTQRAMANLSVNCSDIEDLHPLFWKTYEHGEPFGLVNIKNIQKYGRMGELKKDTAQCVNPCITGDTLVYTADGRGDVTIKQLSEEGKDIPVFCLNNNGIIDVRYMRNPRITGHKKEIYEILLDDGSKIKTTENHKFLLKNGQYVETKNLKIDDSLYLITKYKASIKEIFDKSNSNSQDYWWVTSGQRKTLGEHRIIASFHNNITIPKGYVVHHKNYNASDNRPDNLKIMSRADHDYFHSFDKIGDKNPMRRAKIEWPPEKWNAFVNKQIVNSSGTNNPRYSGFTNDQLREHAIFLTKSLNRRFSISDWKAYAEKLGLPVVFSGWRKNHLGGIIGMAKWAALELNLSPELKKIFSNGHANTIKALKKYLEQGYNCIYENNDILFIKNCEYCKKEIKVTKPEIGLCGSRCANLSRNNGFYKKVGEAISAATKNKHTKLREEQIKIYLSLKSQIQRIPWKKEWIIECKKNMISCEISRSSSPFRSWEELQEASRNYNHKIISITRCGYEDVYNGTVDDFHNFFIGGFKSLTKSGKKKIQYVNNLQCGEATLEDGEPCNLTEIFLPNLDSKEEFLEAAKLMHRWSKRVTCEEYHHKKNDEVIKRNRRVGTGVTGCLQSKLFIPEILDEVYATIQEENKKYSKELGIPESIRTTVIKPSGTVSLLGDCSPGIHPSFSKYYIRRVRFASNDNLIPLLRASGHKIEPVQRFDGTLDNNTLVVDFYCETPDGTPVADENWDTWKQLEILKIAQKHWADQAVSVTVYYKKDDIPELKKWLEENLKELKTISFLCQNDHGFKQAPIEALTEEMYNKLLKNVKPLDTDTVNNGFELDSLECSSGACPIK